MFEKLPNLSIQIHLLNLASVSLVVFGWQMINRFDQDVEKITV